MPNNSPRSKGLATRHAIRYVPRVTLEVSTPALLFPAISLLFLSFTNEVWISGGALRILLNTVEEKR